MSDRPMFPPSPLRIWLREHRVSQMELAILLEVSLLTVSRYCRDLVRPPDEVKVRIAEVTRKWEADNPHPISPAPIYGVPVHAWFWPSRGPRKSRRHVD